MPFKKAIKVKHKEINEALNQIKTPEVTPVQQKKYRTRKMYIDKNWSDKVMTVSSRGFNVIHKGNALSATEVKEALEAAHESKMRRIAAECEKEALKKVKETHDQEKLKPKSQDTKMTDTPMTETKPKTARKKKIVPPIEVQNTINEEKAKTQSAVKAVKDNVRPEMSLLAQKLVDTAVNYVFDMKDAEDNEVLQKIVTQVENELLKKYVYIPSKVIDIKINDTIVHSTTEIVHPKFQDIIRYVSTDIPVFLVGNAGTGKNHLCKQIAKTLGLEFYFTNAVTNEYKITGFIDANGTYHETQFYKAFTEGGLFFMDEVDASIPETLVLLNAAIENRYFNFPTGQRDAHKDFRIIAAGNTFGGGADLQFVGRFQLDAASLDRFSFIEIDYDEEIENFIANGDKDLVDIIRLFRGIVRNLGIRKIVSYRAIGQLSKLIRLTDVDHKNAFYYTLIKDMRPDDLNAVLGKYPQAAMKNNVYITSLKESIQMAVQYKSTH